MFGNGLKDRDNSSQEGRSELIMKRNDDGCCGKILRILKRQTKLVSMLRKLAPSSNFVAIHLVETINQICLFLPL